MFIINYHHKFNKIQKIKTKQRGRSNVMLSAVAGC